MVALSALSACGTNLASSVSSVFGGSSGAPSAPSGWTLWFSPGVTLGAGPSFSFPTWVSPPCPGPTGFQQVCPAVHYLVEGTGPLAVGKTLTMSITITGNNPVWNFANIEQDSNTCTNPAHVRFYFQEAGDDWSGNGPYAYYRWWSSQAIILQPGTYTLSVPLLASAGWTSVNGEAATTASGSAGFGAALANANTIGMTFGGGCFYGHGVDLLSGSATFKVNSFSIQ